mmetsp:Transcript_25647/g.41693  ORF Transcript_25647/g.41693 Transcript_25647/m.41693 type:complete len:659 (-) Transcript_25647:74-2050(-)
MDVIPDEEFDRLWKEAVAEAAERNKKQRKSRSKSHLYAPPKQQRSYKRYNSSSTADHQRDDDEHGQKPSSHELPRPSSSGSMRNELQQSSRRSFETNNSHESRRSSASNDNELTRRRTDPMSRVTSSPCLNEQSQDTMYGIGYETALSSSAHESTRRHRLESTGQLRRRSSSGSSEDDSGFTRRRRSSISKVPSLPCYPEMSKDTMYGREDLTSLYYVDALKPASFHKYQMDEASVSSLVSGFSAYESVSENRRTQKGGTRSKSRSPTRDAQEQNNFDGGKQSSRRPSSEPSLSPEAVKYILEGEPSEEQRLLFDIPTTFEVKGHKKSCNQSTGLVLSFGQENDISTVMVKGISPTSLFADTRLKSGDEILMINSHRVKSPQQAAKIMKSLSGDVTIFASEGSRAPGMKYVRVKAGGKRKMNGHTEDTDSSLHNVILATQNNGLVRVAHVDPGGIFGKTLSVGDAIITVNGALVQNDEEAKKLLPDTRHGVICILIYSMANLCQGLIDQLLPGWKSSRVSELEITLSRDDVSFSVVWGDDWVCECKHDEEAVYISDIQPAIRKINKATSFVMDSIIEASGAQRKQNAFDADCNTCTATTDPTTEGITDPTILEATHVGGTGGESSPAPSKKHQSLLRQGKSLYLELHCTDDESSVDEC